MTSAQYYPAGNGLAESSVQSFKSAMESKTDVKPLKNKYVGEILTSRRNTISGIFGKTTSHPTGSLETRSPLKDSLKEK